MDYALSELSGQEDDEMRKFRELVAEYLEGEVCCKTGVIKNC